MASFTPSVEDSVRSISHHLCDPDESQTLPAENIDPAPVADVQADQSLLPSSQQAAPQPLTNRRITQEKNKSGQLLGLAVLLFLFGASLVFIGFAGPHYFPHIFSESSKSEKITVRVFCCLIGGMAFLGGGWGLLQMKKRPWEQVARA